MASLGRFRARSAKATLTCPLTQSGLRAAAAHPSLRASPNALRAMQDALRDMPLAKTELFSAQSGQGCEAVIGILSEWLAAGQEDDDA